MKRLLRSLVVALCLVLVGPLPAHADFRGDAAGDTITIVGRQSRPEVRLPGGTSSSDLPFEPYELMEYCFPTEDEGIQTCTIHTPNGLLWAGEVANGAPAEAEIAAVVASAFRRLQIVSGGITVQPERGWTLVNVETIVMTDPAPQEFVMTLLGLAVTVRATPTRYAWDFGDDTQPLLTADPGAAWPHHTLSHVYRRAGTRTIALTTEWSGTFRVQGSEAWRPVTGTAVTLESAPPLEVRQARNVLVVPPPA